MNNEEIMNFFGSDYQVIEKNNISHDEILFAVKLVSGDIQKRKLQTEQKKISMNMLKSIFKTIVSNNYLICCCGGRCIFLYGDSDNPRTDVGFGNLDFELSLVPAALNCAIRITDPSCPIESVSFSYGPSDVILGKVSELFRLFGAKHKNYDILTASEEGYYRFSVYRQNIYDTANSFSFGMEYTGDTLLTIGKGFLYLHNADAVLDYGRIVAYSFRQNVYSIVTLEEDTLRLYAISSIAGSGETNPLGGSSFEELYRSCSLIFQGEGFPCGRNPKLLSLPLNTDKMAENSLYAVFFKSDSEKCLFVISDDRLKIGSDQGSLKQSSLFYHLDRMYIQNAENELSLIRPPEKVMKDFIALDLDFNEYFLDFNSPQYLIEPGAETVCKAKLHEDRLALPEEIISFHDVDRVIFKPDSGCAKIAMITGEATRSFVCAFDYAFMIWKKFEYANLSKLKRMTFDEMQSYLNSTVVSRFLYAVFGEIIITNEEINNGVSLAELLIMISNKEGNTLRSMSDSLLTKFRFKSIEDLQEIMLRKVSVIEYHKNRMLILANEWNLIYPHYVGLQEYNRMKQLFGSDSLSRCDLEKDRLEVVGKIRKIAQSINGSISAMLGNMDKPISKIYGLIPSQVKEETSNFASRFSSKSLEFRSGTVVASFKIFTQLSDAMARGIALSDMSNLVVSPAANILSHFAKDSQERRDLKVYGKQILEWWEMTMKYLTFLIVEARQMFSEFIDSRSALYSRCMETMNEDEKKALIEKYSVIIEAEIKDLVEDKFHAVEEKKVYLQNVVDKIEELEKRYAEYIDDFVTKKL